MTKLINLLCISSEPQKSTEVLIKGLETSAWVQLLPPQVQAQNIDCNLLPEGPGVIIKSGGSSGAANHCLHTCKNLDLSAFATGQWLLNQGINPKDCLILNPLPMHHLSGLMPWWRSRCWKAEHKWIPPALMRDPIALEKECRFLLSEKKKPAVISLVPTQLERLVKHEIGLKWLKAFAVIWVGGAAISKSLGNLARKNKLRLAPCYGTTETAAMITAMRPIDFLTGGSGCGSPLDDVEIDLSNSNTLKVRTNRLAKYRLIHNKLEIICDKNGWWQSGDIAQLIHKTSSTELHLKGRIDNAINSGGETIYPEQIEMRLIKSIKKKSLPVEELLISPITDKEWGERLVLIFRLESNGFIKKEDKIIPLLKAICLQFPAHERPLFYLICNKLRANEAGKIERKRWRLWAQNQLLKSTEIPKINDELKQIN